MFLKLLTTKKWVGAPLSRNTLISPPKSTAPNWWTNGGDPATQKPPATSRGFARRALRTGPHAFWPGVRVAGCEPADGGSSGQLRVTPVPHQEPKTGSGWGPVFSTFPGTEARAVLVGRGFAGEGLWAGFQEGPPGTDLQLSCKFSQAKSSLLSTSFYRADDFFSL